MGLVFAIKSSREADALRREYQALTAKFVEFESIDQEGVYIKAIPEKDPWMFAWRIYTSPKFGGHLFHQMTTDPAILGTGKAFVNQELDFIARLRLYPDNSNDHTVVYYRIAGASGFSMNGSTKFLEFLEDHRDQIIVDQLATINKLFCQRRAIRLLS